MFREKSRPNVPYDLILSEDGITHRYTRSQNTEAMNEFNNLIKNWGSKVKSELLQSIGQHEMIGHELRQSLRNNYYTEYGEINRIGFSFRPEGVYVHKGVGRGYVANGDTVLKIAKTPGFNRRPKLWFNPVIENNIPELAKIIEEYAKTVVINTNRIFIQ